MIVIIYNDHHRIENFFNKIEQIINKYKDTIRQMYSNSQILNIFKSNKRILLYLIGNKILKNDIYIRPEIDQFFFPEGQKIDQDFEIKRHQGENDSNICVLIRQDLIKEFVILMNKSKISIEQKIESSLFETNRFLIERNPTLIEYASFFGSIQIFQYLLLNKAKLSPDLWLYSIHGQNPEIIHLLEENLVDPPNNSYDECFIESVKCHHNDFADYFQNNYDVKINEKILISIIHSHNYIYFPFEYNNIKSAFNQLVIYHYYEIVNFLMKIKEQEFDEKKRLFYIEKKIKEPKNIL